MENHNQHNEDEPRFAFECLSCGNIQEIGDNNTILFLADDEEDGEVVEKLFAYISCGSGQCDAVTEEITPDMEQYVAHLSSYYDKTGNKVELLENEVIDVQEAKHWGDTMLEFLQVYDPQPYEFSARLYR